MLSIACRVRHVGVTARLGRRGLALRADGLVPAEKSRFVPSTGFYPTGFSLGTARAGVKVSNRGPVGTDDITVLKSDLPCTAAGVFTTNKFQAAPVVVSKEVVASGRPVTGLVVNSGCANAVTGKGGLDDARTMAAALTGDQGVLVMSTGVIGQRLPIDRIVSGAKSAETDVGDSHNHWLAAARAICTTDTFPKLASRQLVLPSRPDVKYSIAGFAKGAGMIHPNMATMLAVLATDVPVEKSALQQLLRTAVDKSFNSVSVDGDTSTNDTVVLLSNGAAGGVQVTDGADLSAVQQAVTALSTDLAQLVVRDGEGATKFVTIKVEGAASDADAKAIASTIGTSPLVKTALYGRDANWGRILCAVGYAPGVSQDGVRPAETSVSFVTSAGTELALLTNGEPVDVDETKASEMLAEEDITILVKLSATAAGAQTQTQTGSRTGCATFWTCDLSHEYVTINGDYRT